MYILCIYHACMYICDIVIPSGIPPAEFQGCGVALLVKPSNFQAPSAVLEPPRCLSSFLIIFLPIFLDSSGAACADKWRLLHLSSSPSPHSPCSSPPLFFSVILFRVPKPAYLSLLFQDCSSSGYLSQGI